MVNSVFNKFRWIFYFVFLCLCIVGSLALFNAYNSLPFRDIRWTQGYPEININEAWLPLLAINEVGVDQLVEMAINRWGTAYQDRFAMGFHYIMKDAHQASKLYYRLRIQSEGQERTILSWTTRSNYKSFLQAERERKIKQSNLLHTCKTDQQLGWITREEAIEDIRLFEWSLENRFAYLHNQATPYKNMLEEMICTLDNKVSYKEFGLKLARVLASFSDIHSRMSFGASNIQLGEQEMPCQLMVINGKVVCLEPDKKEFIVSGFPYLKSINGFSIIELLFELSSYFPEISDSIYTQKALDYLKNTELLMNIMRQPFEGLARLDLVSTDGLAQTEVVLNCSKPQAKPDFRQAVESRIFSGGIGYLGLRIQLFPGKQFQQEIINAMIGLENTSALILDLRGNRGGKRDAIPLILQYFISPEKKPLILNIASSLIDPPTGFELLQSRYLYSQGWSFWKNEERLLIRQFKGLSPDHHFMILPKTAFPNTYYYAKPIIVLQDDLTASACGLLLSILNKQEKIITLGSISSSQLGYPQAFQLPASNFVYWLSSMASIEPGRSSEPDIPHSLIWKDWETIIKYGKDPLVEQALRILRK